MDGEIWKVIIISITVTGPTQISTNAAVNPFHKHSILVARFNKGSSQTSSLCISLRLSASSLAASLTARTSKACLRLYYSNKRKWFSVLRKQRDGSIKWGNWRMMRLTKLKTYYSSLPWRWLMDLYVYLFVVISMSIYLITGGLPISY